MTAAGARAFVPTKGVERTREERRERYLTVDEISRLSAALEQHPERTSANALRLLLLTGSRRGETLSATWDQFGLQDRVWTKPSSATPTVSGYRRLHCGC